jgi:hypothetical protein
MMRRCVALARWDKDAILQALTETLEILSERRASKQQTNIAAFVRKRTVRTENVH